MKTRKKKNETMSESTRSESGKSSKEKVYVPKFLTQTFELVSEPASDAFVSWNAEGDALVIHNVHMFAEQVLPRFFKHNNFSSFIRQLNMYGFTKNPLEQNSFKHPLFLRGRSDNLKLIKRRLAPRKPNEGGGGGGGGSNSMNREELDEVLKEVKELRNKQRQFDDQMLTLKSQNAHLEAENQMLWDVAEQAKRRQMLLDRKMKQVLFFLHKTFMTKDGKQRIDQNSSLVKELPQILDAAKNAGLDFQDLNQEDDSGLLELVPSTGSPPESSSSSSYAVVKNEPRDNDLIRLQTLGTVPSLDGDDLLNFKYDGNSLTPHPYPAPAPKGISQGQSISLPRSSTQTSNSLLALPPTQGSADDLARSQSLQSFMDVMENVDDQEASHAEANANSNNGKNFGQYNDLARLMSQYINDQDNTIRKLDSISSTLSEPFLPDDIKDVDEDDNSLNDALTTVSPVPSKVIPEIEPIMDNTTPKRKNDQDQDLQPSPKLQKR